MESYCSNCSNNLTVPDCLENQQGTCPFCSGKFQIVKVLPSSVVMSAGKTPPANPDIIKLDASDEIDL